MKLRHFMLCLLLALTVAGCGGSRLFTGDDGINTPGSVPRDEMGEPIWDRIKPPATQGDARDG